MTIDYDEKARELAGNWMKFESFVWHSRPENAIHCAVIPYTDRDDGLLGQSNAEAIEAAIKELGDDAWTERHSHWGCGWVDNIVVRVYGNGEVTEAFKEIVDLLSALEQYPVLDDELYSRKEYEAAIENIESELGSMGAEEKLAELVWRWLWDNDQSALENTDDRGACPSASQVQRAIRGLVGQEATFISRADQENILDNLGGRIVNSHHKSAIFDGMSDPQGIFDNFLSDLLEEE